MEDALVEQLTEARMTLYRATMDWASHPCPNHLRLIDTARRELARVYSLVRSVKHDELLEDGAPLTPVSEQETYEDVPASLRRLRLVEQALKASLVSCSDALIAAAVQAHSIEHDTVCSRAILAHESLAEALRQARSILLSRASSYRRDYNPEGYRWPEPNETVERASDIVSRLGHRDHHRLA